MCGECVVFVLMMGVLYEGYFVFVDIVCVWCVCDVVVLLVYVNEI